MCKDMKKVTTIILILSFLTLQGCDFLRRVAGRPTSDDLQAKAHAIELRDKSVSDSLERERERIRQELVAAEAARLDSLETVRQFEQMDVRLSSVFTYGAPLVPLQHKYNMICGVFRKADVARRHFNKLEQIGFEPAFIDFEGGVKALCVASSDRLSDLYAVYVHGRNIKAIPADSWVYVASKSRE